MNSAFHANPVFGDFHRSSQRGIPSKLVLCLLLSVVAMKAARTEADQEDPWDEIAVFMAEDDESSTVADRALAGSSLSLDWPPEPMDVPGVESPVRSLHGVWRFRSAVPKDFRGAADTDMTDWATVQVPGDFRSTKHSIHTRWLGEVDPDGRRCYLACLFAMDEAVGSILDALDEQEIAVETLVVFVSDNGGSRNTYSCNGPLHGHKYTLTEGGVRVPMIMRWPSRIPRGHTNDALVASLDIAATCVDAAGGDPPDNLDGKSLLPLLAGSLDSPVQDALFWDQGHEGHEAQRSIDEIV